MRLNDLLSAIDSEIAHLQQARALLTNSSVKKHTKKRILSPEARKRIADAQRKRWAEQKKAAKKAA
jgi:hypothetical protein